MLFQITSTADRRRCATVLALALLFMVLVEMGLQARQHRQTGRSIFTTLLGRPTFVYNRDYDIKLLRPSSTIAGQKIVIQTNKLGFRDNDIKAGEQVFRLAIVGPSSVFGATTKRNRDRFSDVIESRLNEAIGPDIDVLNLGIPGTGTDHATKVIAYVSDQIPLDAVFLYPGFSHITGMCRRFRSGELQTAAPRLAKAAGPKPPSWLLSVELLIKNTSFLRVKPVTENPAATALLTASAADHSLFVEALHMFIADVRARGAVPILSTVGRSYRHGMDPAVARPLAAGDLFYNDCFDLEGLLAVTKQANALIRTVAAEEGVLLFDAEEILPSGADHFDDSSHFSDRGNTAMAQELERFLVSHGIFQG